MKGSLVGLTLALTIAACGLRLPPAADGGPTEIPQPPSPSATSSASSAEPVPTAPTPLIPTAETLPVVEGCGPRPQTHYSLNVTFDFDTHRLQVNERIFYFNAAPEALESLVLVVDANRREGVFSLGEVRLADGRPLDGSDLQGGRLDLPLLEPVPPGEGIELTLSYGLEIPPRRGPLGYTPLQTNLGDWYPFVAPYSPEERWIVHEPGQVGEYLVEESADFSVHIELVDPPQGLTIAASAPEADTDGAEFLLCDARSFAWSASTEYERLRATAGDTLVTAYVFQHDAPAGPSALSAAAAAVDAFSGLFAAYPHSSLAVVEADFYDGMEYDGLVFIGSEYFQDDRTSPANYLTTLTAHEVAHQWWYGLAGNDPAAEPWLDEALATYSELLFYERARPELTDWWWDFRVARFEPQGWVDSRIYEQAAFRPYVDAVYLRGALFLHEVRGAMGDEAFFAFLRDYLAHAAFRLATGADFFAAMDRWGGEELEGIRSRYFRSVP